MTMTIDLIVTWPTNCDYPLFRQWLRTDRHRFNNVYVIFHKTNTEPNFQSFVYNALWDDKVIGVTYDEVPSGRDWRDFGIQLALEDSKSTHVLFIEQDFFMFDGFWEQVSTYMGTDEAPGYPVIGVLDGKRWHPCFLLMKRSALEATCKDFGIVPDKLDHFGQIQLDMEAGKCGALTAIPDYPNKHLYHHMNGLSHNLRLMFDYQPITYYPDEFRAYLERSVKVDLPLDSRYLKMVEEYLKTA